MASKLKYTAAAFLFTAALITGIPDQGRAAAKQYLSLGTGNSGGTFYFIGAGFASIFNKHVPEVRVIAESTAASEENFHYILRKKMDMALAGLSVIEPALEKKLDISGIRLMAMGHTSDRHWIVRKDSPIKTVSDFKGKKVVVGSPGSGTLIHSRIELAACGLSFDDIKPAYLSQAECMNAIKDGTVDVGLVDAGIPVASILDLGRQIPIRLVSFTEGEMKALLAKRPFCVRIVIPAGTYPGVTSDTLTRGSLTAFYCRRDLSENVVYQLLKALYEHPKERDAIHPQAKHWKLENILRGTDYANKYVPFHPGAVKYLKEKGLWKGNG